MRIIRLIFHLRRFSIQKEWYSIQNLKLLIIAELDTLTLVTNIVIMCEAYIPNLIMVTMAQY